MAVLSESRRARLRFATTVETVDGFLQLLGSKAAPVLDLVLRIWVAQAFFPFLWDHADGSRLLVAVNYVPHQGQCRVALPVSEITGKVVLLADLMSEARYGRQGDDHVGPGLYLDMPAWGYHVFDLTV